MAQPSFMHRLFTTEFEIDEKYRPIATGVIILFAVLYSAAFLGLMQYVAYLGPGLGDNLDFRPFMELYDGIYQYAGGSWQHPALLLFFALVTINLIFSIGIIIAGYTLYPKLKGKPFPITVLFTYLSLNALCTMGIWSIQIMGAFAAPLFGYDTVDGLKAFGTLLEQMRHWANQVPTLIELPAWAAFLAINMIGGFFHYWFHRLAHESRILWLLFHRTHHMTPELIQPSTQAVFNTFPFFVFAAVPYVVIFTVIGKLITSESIIAYLITYKLFSAFANLWSHQTALYDWAHRRWYIRFLSTITSEGVYHYLHHSAEDEHNNDRGNLINIGGGLFFVWDRLFGTYRPVTDHQPRVGLMGIEADEMTTNPLRLAFAGVAQVTYELWHNRSVGEWAMILAGPSDYVPPKSRDYVLRAIR